MKCPCCRGATSVKDSRPQDDGTIRRKRVCRKGHVTTTWESNVDPSSHLKARKQNRGYVKGWWDKLSDDERHQKQKRYRLRSQARKEAEATGKPVQEIFQQWGVA